MAMNVGKKYQVELKTFLGYGKDAIIGHKSVEEGGRKYVNFIWCKVCARNKDAILSDPSMKGSIKTAAKALIDGTNVVTKYQVSETLFFVGAWNSI